MKIGILTLPPTINYGGILQAYALQCILDRMGHEAEIICDRQRHFMLPTWKKPFVYFKRLSLKHLLGKKNLIIRKEVFKRNKACQHTEVFIRKHLHIHQYNSFCEIKESDFDAIVVGSDQIWRTLYNYDIERRFLDFAETWDIQRVAYAASFGTDAWEYNERQTENCKRLIRLFNAVSVREESGVELVKKYLGATAVHVLDPTMLLNKNDYISFFEEARTGQSPGDMLCYILDESPTVKERIAFYQDQQQLTPFHVYSHYDRDNCPPVEWIQPPVEEWLRGFYDAKLVVTDSFHATVFSIIFGKPFVVLGNAKRGNARFASLLNMTGFDISEGLFNRIYYPSEKTEIVLNTIRDYSMQFLKESLTIK